jgi:hypothetical protein
MKLPAGALGEERRVHRCLPSTLLDSCPDQQPLLQVQLAQVLLQVRQSLLLLQYPCRRQQSLLMAMFQELLL